MVVVILRGDEIMSIIPSRDYACKHKDVEKRFRRFGESDFSGMVIYSMLEGNATVCVEVLEDGVTIDEASVYDRTRTHEENLARMQSFVDGAIVRMGRIVATRGEGPIYNGGTLSPVIVIVKPGGGGNNPPPSGGGGYNPPPTPPSGGGTPSPPAKPDKLERYIGTNDYYNQRVKDFKARYPSKTPPSYYKEYGEKYMNRFDTETKPKLSQEGKEWVDKTKESLQRKMSQILADDNTIELRDNAFTEAAFRSHVDAYVENGICELGIKDKFHILTTVDFSDLTSSLGREQIAGVAAAQIEVYRNNPSFALQQALELSNLHNQLTADAAQYIFKRIFGGTRSAMNISPEEIIQMVYGAQIEYFQQTFVSLIHSQVAQKTLNHEKTTDHDDGAALCNRQLCAI